MSIDGIAALVFIFFLGIFLWIKRKNLKLHRALFPLLYIITYSSSFGLISMNRLAKKFPRFLRFMGYLSIVLGFIGMILICGQLVYNTFDVFTKDGVPGIQPVLPIEAKGVFFVPFLYWILSIFLLALVHEFSHGVLARAHNMPVKSSGFAFLCVLLPIVPAAFVEPDENVVKKRPYKQQLSVFAAGPISNMFFAAAMIGLFFVLSPVMSAAYDEKGIELVGVTDDTAAFNAGLREGDILVGMNNVTLTSSKNITSLLNASSPGDSVFIETSNRSVSATLGQHPQKPEKAYLGISARPYLVPNEEFVSSYGAWLPPALKWLAGLIFWLFMLNIGIGLFNLLPIGPLDGGRMFQLVCFKLFKRKETALKIWSWVSIFFVVIILANLFVGFIR